MHVIKVMTNTAVYMNIESILYFYYNAEVNKTYIKMKTEDGFFGVDGNISAKLAKAIATATNGSILNLG